MGISLLVGIDGMEGIAITGIDQTFNCVELAALQLAFPGEVNKLAVFGIILIESPETELNLRVKLDAAEAKTMASCAEM